MKRCDNVPQKLRFSPNAGSAIRPSSPILMRWPWPEAPVPPCFVFSKPVSEGLIRELTFENGYRESRAREITRSHPNVLGLLDYHRLRDRLAWKIVGNFSVAIGTPLASPDPGIAQIAAFLSSKGFASCFACQAGRIPWRKMFEIRRSGCNDDREIAKSTLGDLYGQSGTTLRSRRSDKGLSESQHAHQDTLRALLIAHPSRRRNT